jgi:hypothetical protein
MQEEFPENTELSDGVVRYLGGSGTLFAENTNSDMGLHDHVGVISPISDG